MGKKKQPQYRVVVIEKQKDPWADALEIVGNYDPRAKKDNIVLNKERIEHWLSVGAQPSATVQNMLINAGIVKADKARSVSITNRRADKMDKKKTDAEEVKAAAKVAAEAAKTAEAEKSAAEAEAAKTAEEAETPAEAPVETAPEAPAETKTEAPAVTEAPAEAIEAPAEVEAPAEKTEE